jgi:hypothetical protein
VISLIYDQTLGATTPQIVKDDLEYWLAAAQVPGQGGAACYQPDYWLCDHSDTGGLLLGLHFVGKTQSDLAVQDAITFLSTNWQQFANGTWYGNFGHPYAMWSVYKGLEVNIGLKDNLAITNLLDPTCGGGTGHAPAAPCNWWEDYNEWLVRNRNLDGSWTGYDYWTGPLATAFSINILGATEVPPAAQCDIDTDGDIDRNDVNAILAVRGQFVPPANPLLDTDGDKKITVNDGRKCVLLCTRKSCAP